MTGTASSAQLSSFEYGYVFEGFDGKPGSNRAVALHQSVPGTSRRKLHGSFRTESTLGRISGKLPAVRPCSTSSRPQTAIRPGAFFTSSIRAVAAHQHAIQSAMLALVEVKAGFMQRRPVIDNHQVDLLVFVRVAKMWLSDFIGQVLQEILRFLRRHTSDLLGLALVKPDSLGTRFRVRAHQWMYG